MTQSAEAYANAGVNLDAADAAKRAMRDAIRTTHGPQVLGALGGFGGLFALDTSGLREPVLVSSIDGVAINVNSDECRNNVLAIDKLLHDYGAPITPRQLITGGYGNHRDLEISNLSLPASDSYYGSTTMSEHCNHIHYGV